LHEVSLDVGPAELVTVFGPSGDGKTTLLRVIAGLHRPSAGRVVLDGTDVTEVPVERRAIGLVPQEGALFPHRTVEGNVGYGLPRSARAARVPGLLELIGMAEFARSMPHELSGGQRQRVALARALAPRPKVLLLDEPFSALDAGMRVQLRDETTEILRVTGTTTVLVTHDREEALALSDRIAVLDAGRVLAVGSPRTLYDTPSSQRIAELLGGAHLVAAEPCADGVRTALGVLDVLKPIPSNVVGGGTTLRALLRPEQLRLTSDTRDGGAGDEPGYGTVRRCEYHGDGQLIEVQTAAIGPITVHASAALNIYPGEVVRLSVIGPVHVIVE
jgi:iron(III) transport system ATP-binding protein